MLHGQEFELSLIRSRTKEGFTRAKARGQRSSRPLRLVTRQSTGAWARVDGGEPVGEVGRIYNVSPSMIRG
jgi:DNA invertase Pin-like site-specific DNA recombinase